MAEEDRVDISEEVNPPAPAHSQPPPTHAPPPPTPAGVPPAYSGAPSMHLPPPTSSGAPLPQVSLTSFTSDDHARIAALGGLVNQLAASMTTNMAELFALLRGPNCSSSSSTPPSGQGPMVDPTSWTPPTQVPENTDAPAPPTMHTSTIHPFTSPFLPPPAPTAVPLPPAAFLSSKQALFAPPPIFMPAPAAVYTVPPPMVFPVPSAPTPTHPQAAELPSYPPLQPHTSFPYQAPPPINTTFLEPGTPTHAAQFASPTHFFPEADAKQERRLERMEETIRALQANEARPNARYGDCSLFPGMRLPSKVKIPEFRIYEGTTDPRHHLRHYQGKMLQYWDYEEFVIHSFQDSLSGSTLDWFMSLKADDIPTWADLSRKFIDQYQYCAETPPTLLELSMKEMAQGQRFEEYTTKWRAQAAKHIPPISEVQQIQLFHSTLRGVYYSHLLAHTSSFSDLIKAEKKLDLGIKLGRMEGPTNKGEEPSKKASAMTTSSSGRMEKEVTVNAVNPAHPTPHGPHLHSACASISASTPYPTDLLLYTTASTPTYAPGSNFDPTTQDQSKQCEYHRGAPGHTLDTCWRLRERIQEMIDAKELSFNAVRSPNVQANPLSDHGPARGPSINMISICALREGQSEQGGPSPFVIEYVPAEAAVGFTGIDASPAPFVIGIPVREPYSDDKVPWTYEGGVGNLEQQFGVMGITRSGRVYENPTATDKGKAPAAEIEAIPGVPPTPPKKVTEEEAEAFMKIIKASEYKVVEQMAKSPAHISLLALLLSSEPHREALLRVLTAAQVPKGTPPNRIEETVSSIFSNTISFSNDELPSEGCAHSRALHIVCKCNNHIVGRVMIDNGSALNMNVDLNRVRPSKIVVRAFDDSRREVNGEIDLLIDVGPCSFSVTFQVLDIPNAFSLLLGRPWIHSACAIPSSLHQKLKFIIEERIITVKGEEDYTMYKETVVPYFSVGNDENLPFHSFETISVIWDYGEIGPSRADRVIGKVLSRHNYIPGSGLGARGQGINRPIEVEEYKHRRGLGFRSSYHEIIEARRGNHLHRFAAHYGRLNRGIPIPPLSHFFPGPPLIIGSTLDGPSSDFDDTPDALPTVYVVTEEIPSGVHIRPVQEMRSLTTGPQSRAIRLLHSNPNLRHIDSNPLEECLGEPGPIYFEEGLGEDSQVLEIEESLRHLKDRQLTSVEPTKEINVGTEDEPRTLKIGTGLDPTQRARMIDFLTRYQEVFAWSYVDMPSLDPSIVKHFLPLDTEKFPPKRQRLRWQRASLLLHIKEEVVKQINAGFLEVCNYFEWVANIVPRAMITLFHNMMHKEVEVYVDDMIAKSKEGEDHLVNLKRLFDLLKEYKLRLNPAKCTFGARSGKLLGFVVSEREAPTIHTLSYDSLTVKGGPPKYLLDSPSSMWNIAKWRCQLTEYDIEYVSRTSVKGQPIADHLAEFPIEDSTPINPDFPDEGILQVDGEEEKPGWKMYFDGAVNSTGSGIGAVLISPDGRCYPVRQKLTSHAPIMWPSTRHASSPYKWRLTSR
ncbi:hypothetical protein CRG98_018309 [Punica granatum]|uniref:G-patch domain-containing protein n=1 Tax=Punica granatum TaxID=22663 RepID=A0A2I0JY99_PUNGR|nr:hypothetical protein CRG98_018309 [Punica granatum]